MNQDPLLKINKTIDSIRCLLHFLINEFEYFEDTIHDSENLISTYFKRRAKKHLPSTRITIRSKKFIKIRRKLQKKRDILGQLTFEANNFLHELKEIDNSLSNEMNIDLNLNWNQEKINTNSLTDFINFARSYIREMHRCYFEVNHKENTELFIEKSKSNHYIGQIIELENDETFQETENLELSKEINENKSKNQYFVELINNYKNQIDNLLIENNELKLNKENVNLKTAMEHLQTRIIEKQNDYEKIKQILNQDTEFINKLQAEIVEKNLQILSLENQCKEISIEIEEKNKQINDIIKNNDSLQNQYQEILHRNNELENLICLKNETIEKMTEEKNNERDNLLISIKNIEVEKNQIIFNYKNCLREIEKTEKLLKEKDKKVFQLKKNNKLLNDQLKWYKLFVNGLASTKEEIPVLKINSKVMGDFKEMMLKNPLEKRLFHLNYELVKQKGENDIIIREKEALKKIESELNMKIKNLIQERNIYEREWKEKLDEEIRVNKKLKENLYQSEEQNQRLNKELTEIKANEKIKKDELNLKKNQENEEIKSYHNEPLTLIETTYENRDNCKPKESRSLSDDIIYKNYFKKPSELNFLEKQIDQLLNQIQMNQNQNQTTLTVNKKIIKNLEEKLLTSKSSTIVDEREDLEFEEIIEKLITAIKLILNEKERNTKYHLEILKYENIVESLQTELAKKSNMMDHLKNELKDFQMTFDQNIKLKNNTPNEIEIHKQYVNRRFKSQTTISSEEENSMKQKRSVKENEIKLEDYEMLKLRVDIFQDKSKRLNEELNESRIKFLNVRSEQNKNETKMVQLQAEKRDLFWELKALQGILNEEKNLREQLQQAVKDFLNYLQNENVPIDDSAYLYLQILATTASANEETWNYLKLANNKS